ncbi:MAG: glycosyltransferase [Planctomycetes bacterium]|nr:glycosyltransferase [Planctomycetota bacterium]
MRESLSIVLPIRDRQSSIQSRTEDLLELLSELSDDVQILVADDHSCDATPEILDDLRRMYPQVDVIRHPRSLGPSQAAESVLHKARGEFIFLHQSYDQVDFEEVMQLWQLRRDDQLVIARAATRVRRIDQRLFQRLQDWGRRLEEQWPVAKSVAHGLQMMNRDGVQGLSQIRDTASELEVTHQSHRRISGPKFGQIEPVSKSSRQSVR